MMTRGYVVLLALVALLGSTVDARAQQAKCLAGKTKCVAALAGASLKCHVTAETPGKTPDPNAGGCLDKATAKFDGGALPEKGCFGKLEAKVPNDCVTTGDVAPVHAAVVACVDQAVAAIDPGQLDQSKCNAGKKKCVSTRVAGLLKCHQLARTPGKDPSPNAKGCLDKVGAKYDGGIDPAKGCFAKLEAKQPNDCLAPVGNSEAVAAAVDACLDAVLSSLATPPSTTSTSSTTTSTSTTSSSLATTTTTIATTTTTTSVPTTTSSSSTTTTSAPTTTTTTTTINPLCGNGSPNPGESCDDGNNSNNDLCPADCTIDACTFGTTVDRDVTVRFAPPAGGSVAGITVLVDYPEGLVHINGAATTIPSGTITGTIGGAINSFTELNHALRGVVARGSALPPGQLFKVKFKACTGAPVPVAGDFPCQVLDASDQFSNPVSGATCFVTIP